MRWSAVQQLQQLLKLFLAVTAWHKYRKSETAMTQATHTKEVRCARWLAVQQLHQLFTLFLAVTA
jgi:hypothetical protein